MPAAAGPPGLGVLRAEEGHVQAFMKRLSDVWAPRSVSNTDGDGRASQVLSSPDCRKPYPLEMQCWPRGTPASGVRSARSSGHPTGQPAPPSLSGGLGFANIQGLES